VKGASILVQTILSSIRKDFRVEFRGRYAINVSVAFAFITTLSISFATGGTAIRPAIQAIFLWVILFFSAMNSLSHVFTREEEESTALFLRLHSSAETVFLSKLLYNMAVFMFLEILIVPLCVFFFSITVGNHHHCRHRITVGGAWVSFHHPLLSRHTSRIMGNH